MKMSNTTLIALLNGLTIAQDIPMPIQYTFQLSQNIDVVYAAYRPYSIAYEKILNQYDTDERDLKLSELLALEVDVNIAPMSASVIDYFISSGALISTRSFKALQHYIFTEEDNG